MFDLNDNATAPDTLELADFTASEIALLGEAVGEAATAALAMLCTAVFDPEAAAFVIRGGVVVSPGAYH